MERLKLFKNLKYNLLSMKFEWLNNLLDNELNIFNNKLKYPEQFFGIVII